MVTSSALFLLASLIGQPEEPPSFLSGLDAATFYYKAPDPAFGPKMLKELVKRENLKHPFFVHNDNLHRICAALLGDIAAGKPKIVREYEAAFIEAPPAGQSIIILTLRNCGDQETIKQISTWRVDRRAADVRAKLDALKEHLEDPKRKHTRDLPAREPIDLDFLWANFFITGEYTPIARLLDVFDLPNGKDTAKLQFAAKWSLGSNMEQHPKLVELVRKHAKDRPNGSRKVLDELLGFETDAKAQEALRAVFVGKWTSNDDQKIPLEFHKDGTAIVGSYKEKEGWVIATGTYTVSDKGSLKCQVKYDGTRIFQTWELKDGILVGHAGIREDVRWVKVKDNKGTK